MDIDATQMECAPHLIYFANRLKQLGLVAVHDPDRRGVGPDLFAGNTEGAHSPGHRAGVVRPHQGAAPGPAIGVLGIVDDTATAADDKTQRVANVVIGDAFISAKDPFTVATRIAADDDAAILEFLE